ncbi:MAG: hypothetical protein WCI73_00470 [Phycisphaerae bacterium]
MTPIRLNDWTVQDWLDFERTLRQSRNLYPSQGHNAASSRQIIYLLGRGVPLTVANRLSRSEAHSIIRQFKQEGLEFWQQWQAEEEAEDDHDHDDQHDGRRGQA